jgi:hypothetical protein
VRTPLALHLSSAVRAAVVRRAVVAGVDPDGPDFAAYVGNLILRGLPAAVADILRVDDGPPVTTTPRPQPGVVCDSSATTSSPAASLADPAPQPGAARRARPSAG